MHEDGYYASDVCGRVSGYKKECWKYVYNCYIHLLVCDFLKVVIELVNRNVSKYGYYITQLASRRGLSLINKPCDLKV